MPSIKQFFNAMIARPGRPQVPDPVEEHHKMPGSFPSSPPSSPANTKSKRPVSPASPDPQPKRQKTQHPAQASESQPQPAPKVDTERQQKRDFIVGGDVEFPEPASGGGSSGPLQPQQNDPDDNAASGGGSSGPRIYHNGPEARRMGGIFKPPPRPIVWPMAPKDMKIEDMPGFRGYVMRNGRRYPDFDEDTWEKGFSRTLRKHLSNRFKREV